MRQAKSQVILNLHCVGLLLLIHVFCCVALIVCMDFVLGPCFVMQYFFCNHPTGEERDGCFTLVVFCHVSVVVLVSA